MDYTLLINKENPINKEYKLGMLIDANSLYKRGIMLEKKTYNNWLKLKKNLEKKGYYIELESGYRSYDYQTKVLNSLIKEKGEEYACKAVALPGYSEHQSGLALDYCVMQNNDFITEHDIKETRESIYANSIAHKYGFIVRYPEGKESITSYQYEPWHLRYVGKKLATYLYTHNLTLDEYYLTNNDAKNGII